uniref:Uncharacterized protein LOC111132732 n=1 Tax=Crassostrea virginica TaxID=6565 RepID=A0A8B8E9K4_CRAVI|nr:uncharacterized protein LOC111132732 [Crassostrea virginica]
MDPRHSAQDVLGCTLCKTELALMHLDMFQELEAKKGVMKKDLHEIEKSILPKYEEAASNIQIQKDDQRKNSQKLTPELKKHGEALHIEIDMIIENKQTEIDVLCREHNAALDKQFGSLTLSSIETEGQGYNLPSPGAESSPPDRPLLNVPQLITELDTGYGILYGVSCLSDNEIWTRGENKNLKLYNLGGELMKSVQTKSGNVATDMAVDRSGGLVYTDCHDRSINLVSGKQIQKLITLRGWKPRGVCSTSSNDLLVVIDSDDLGITTDSQGNILTSDFDNHRIHIIDQDGHFLRYIENSGLATPWGVCVDSRDNLFVTEYRGKVKKIQYYQ